MHTEIFKKLYYQGRNQKIFDAGLEKVKLFIASNFDRDFTLNELKIGRHASIKGYELQIENNVAFFPISTKPIKNHAHIDWLSKIFFEVDLIAPPFCFFDKLAEFAEKIRLATNSESKNDMAKHYFTLIYPLPMIAAMCTERYKNSQLFLQNFIIRFLKQ